MSPFETFTSIGFLIALLTGLRKFDKLKEEREALSTRCAKMENDLAKACREHAQAIAEQKRGFDEQIERQKKEAEKKDEYIAKLRDGLHTCMILFRQHRNQIGPEPEHLFDDAKAKK